jgi:hypothetical protein
MLTCMTLSFAMPYSDEIAPSLWEDTGDGSYLLSNDIDLFSTNPETFDTELSSYEPSNSDISQPAGAVDTFFLSDDTIFPEDDILLPSDIDSPTLIAQSRPGSDGSSLEFNDRLPESDPQCEFPKSLRCCPVDNFSQCIPYSPNNPLCKKLRTLYCCHNERVSNDGTAWKLVCDKSVVLPGLWDEPSMMPSVDDALDAVTDFLDQFPPLLPLFSPLNPLWN